MLVFGLSSSSRSGYGDWRECFSLLASICFSVSGRIQPYLLLLLSFPPYPRVKNWPSELIIGEQSLHVDDVTSVSIASGCPPIILLDLVTSTCATDHTTRIWKLISHSPRLDASAVGFVRVLCDRGWLSVFPQSDPMTFALYQSVYPTPFPIIIFLHSPITSQFSTFSFPSNLSA